MYEKKKIFLLVKERKKLFTSLIFKLKKKSKYLFFSNGIKEMELGRQAFVMQSLFLCQSRYM